MSFSLLIIFLSFHIISSIQKIPEEYEVAPWYLFKPSVITYSFDDGSFNHLLKAIPLLDKYNFKATFNLITQLENDYEGFRAAAENGHEIASHTISHPNIKEFDKETQTKELKESKKLIEKMIGQECVTLAYPYCFGGDVEIAKKYYISARGCSSEYISHDTDNFFDLSSFPIGSAYNIKTGEDLNKIVNKGLEQKRWTVFLIHGIDNDGGFSPLETIELENHFKYVTENENNFWVATFKDVTKYILEANSLIILENKKDENNFEIEVSIEYKTDITTLDVPITVSRKLNDKCQKVDILKESDLKEVSTEIKEGKIIFDVVPGEKYIMKCE